VSYASHRLVITAAPGKSPAVCRPASSHRARLMGSQQAALGQPTRRCSPDDGPHAARHAGQRAGTVHQGSSVRTYLAS